ncbi:hypothetical protein [Staphylococcus simulans]|uniref:hypothetical protein n=1 Tax=Staphylococcus simulans TaxID=1286 RepID=UPI003F7DD01C
MSPNFKDNNHLMEFYSRMQSNAVIALDNHPVSYYLMEFLEQQDQHVSIVTYSTDIMKFVCRNTHFNIIFAPGKVDQAQHIMTGNALIEQFKTLHIHYYFCQASYIDEADKLYQSHPDVAEIQKVLVQQADETFLINFPDLTQTPHLYWQIGNLK